MPYKILLIDDEEKLRALLSRIIGLEGFEVVQAADCKAGMAKLEQDQIDIVLCDVKLPDGNGVDLTKSIKEKFPEVEVILLTAYGNIPDGVQAIKNGAFDYIIKGDDNNKIIPLLFRVAEKIELVKKVTLLERRLDSKYSFGKIIGKSKAILQVIELAQKVAETDTSVLLTGETGTGKEVFAQAIHQHSKRSKQSFVAVNCSAFSKDLLESEMFGHKAGAFTGAIKEQKGLFEEADNGTIFLDEIGDMAFDLQAKLLRVLESGEFIKIGNTKPTKINVRVIAATNRDLQNEISAGHFRQDLFYRISVFQITLPPLRQHLGDIEELVKYFIALFSGKTNKGVKSIADACLDALQRHDWPGNIREMRNVIERSVILTDGEEINIESLPEEIRRLNAGNGDNTKRQLSAFDLASAEKLHIQKVLNYSNGNKTETAKLLNIALTTLYRKLEEYKIK
ncbi:MAG: sigma-54-dependent Fis family transcriptional regulator [Chitinophagaceae bacterium]|nr:sigma-54-dependent Fis family transcriptional regulator [Chitinophagaceae bacterium]